MGAHNTLFWISLAAGVAVLGLIALFKMVGRPAPGDPAASETQDLPGGET